MKLLLDTHVLLWALSEPEHLSPETINLLRNPVHQVVISVVTAWEIAIKQSLDKLTLPGPAERWLPDAVERTGIEWISITPEDALRVRALPWHHRDPFDRLLVSQVREGVTLVTHDPRFRPYGIPILWA